VVVHAYVSSDCGGTCICQFRLDCSLHGDSSDGMVSAHKVIYVLAGIIVIRGSLPTPLPVCTLPRISLGGHLSSCHLADKLLDDWKGLQDHSCLISGCS
jgi:hypothetical protein